jgi:hypothetical protein
MFFLNMLYRKSVKITAATVSSHRNAQSSIRVAQSEPFFTTTSQIPKGTANHSQRRYVNSIAFINQSFEVI